ncbi:MAG: GNAT family N-acetyltransferase [Acidimicrobiales bacterium]
MATLQPMTPEEIGEFRARHIDEYVHERVEAGESPETAHRIAVSQHEEYYTGGVPAPGHHHYRVIEDAKLVGSLWLGPAPGDRPSAAWVYLVEIDEAHRGKGYGRAAMLLAEDEARRLGATELGLNVFGPNKVARSLYESLGYQTASIQMRKRLEPTEPTEQNPTEPT